MQVESCLGNRGARLLSNLASTPTAPTNLWPRCGASAAILRGCEILLMQRSKGAFTGLWSLPGGHIEPGETARDAALREVREETLVDAEILGLIDVHDIILRNPDGGLASHYLLAVFHGRWLSGEPEAASDSLASRFYRLDELVNLPMTDGAREFIRQAVALQRPAGLGTGTSSPGVTELPQILAKNRN